MRAEELLDAKRRHRDEQHKYTYFLLAISVAAIGFAIKTTTGMQLSWEMSFLGLAVILWGLSFWFGCRNRLWATMTLFASIGLIQLEDDIHPEQPQDPLRKTIAIKGVSDAEQTNANKAGFYGRWQFRLLIAGGLLFCIWHVLELIKITTAT